MSLYAKRGVSAQKEEIHEAVKDLDEGLFPKAFCKIYRDINGDSGFVNVMHADGAGTKSILAYLYWKETGDISVWQGIAQDAIVMNLDDLLCIGVYDKINFNSTIDRNKNLIPGEVIKEIINGSAAFFESMKTYGINIQYCGGETADVGDVVRTIAVNGTMAARWPKEKIISNEKIKAGNVIVGLASFGKANYEKNDNSGIGSNGLTSARHDLLSKHYAKKFPESFDPSLPNEVVYIGPNKISDIPGILSPTRTYAPFIKTLLENHFEWINGLIHCSGGGQTKCLKYIPENVKIIKDNLFCPPEIFKKIQAASGADNREMYQVFNMGCRMEIYTDPEFANEIISIANKFKIDAQIIGRVEASDVKSLEINVNGEKLLF
ncbi:MAG: phosphoribosylformylglycinamidine cyclo-ligase [Bacteroidetes bacterium]|nr:phosphoribosylformylglycinamidine cyclo-ligase [Bacteroidota bacterium]